MTLIRSDLVIALSILLLLVLNYWSISIKEVIYNRPIKPIIPFNNPGPTNNPTNKPKD